MADVTDSVEVDIEDTGASEELTEATDPLNPANAGETGGDPKSTEEGGEEKLYAGKYKSVEEMEKGYLELQRKASGGKIDSDEGEEKAPAEPPADGKISMDAESVEEAADSATLDKALSEYADEGKVSDATLKALSEQGISEAHINTFISGQEALAAQATKKLQDAVGGEEAFGQILDWAKSNLSAEEAQAYNAAIDRGDSTTATMLLRGIKSQYDAKVGTDPNLVGGETTPPSGTKPFASGAEMEKAIADPRYKTDKAYRDKVDERTAISDVGMLF